MSETQRIADDIVTNWINGNRTDAIDNLLALPKSRAVLVALCIGIDHPTSAPEIFRQTNEELM
jgi:hypothetical protein